MNKRELQNKFRKTMGDYPTGVTLITTRGKEGEPIGMIANSFTSLSMEPTLILWSIDHRVSTYEQFMSCNEFAVHILAADQTELVKKFTSKGDRFADVKWSLSSNNIPVVKETLAVLECEVFNRVEAGDHTIIIGEVHDVTLENKEPMLYHRRVTGEIPKDFYPEEDPVKTKNV